VESDSVHVMTGDQLERDLRSDWRPLPHSRPTSRVRELRSATELAIVHIRLFDGSPPREELHELIREEEAIGALAVGMKSQSLVDEPHCVIQAQS
jgi:hypothetical protein